MSEHSTGQDQSAVKTLKMSCNSIHFPLNYEKDPKLSRVYLNAIRF